mmetsp:Transcript_30196/g.66202  ORF Transcript_30196/g.66202 Transcript_30196/m.66202 type:complete len:125 (-) Transcript_30196:1397-1771(-)
MCGIHLWRSLPSFSLGAVLSPKDATNDAPFEPGDLCPEARWRAIGEGERLKRLTRLIRTRLTRLARLARLTRLCRSISGPSFSPSSSSPGLLSLSWLWLDFSFLSLWLDCSVISLWIDFSVISL